MAQPIPIRVASWVAGTFLVALASFMTLGEYSRTVRVRGVLTPVAGTINVVASQPGRIAQRFVKNGDRVLAGAPLFELSAERTSSTGPVDTRIAASLSKRRAEQEHTRHLYVEDAKQRSQSLLMRHRAIEREISSRRQEVALQDTQVKVARDKFTRHEALTRKGFLSPARLSEIESELTLQLGRRKALESNTLVSERELLNVQDEWRALKNSLQLTMSQSQQALATLDQDIAEHEGRNRQLVVSPVAGLITAVALERGQTVAAGTPLATVLPNGDLEAHLLAPSNAIGFIKPGQQVRLRMDAYPYQKFGLIGGTVVQVDGSPASDTRVSGAPVFRVTVRLGQQSVSAYGIDEPFRAGTTFEADIVQDRRHLIEWVIDPLMSVAK